MCLPQSCLTTSDVTNNGYFGFMIPFRTSVLLTSSHILDRSDAVCYNLIYWEPIHSSLWKKYKKKQANNQTNSTKNIQDTFKMKKCNKYSKCVFCMSTPWLAPSYPRSGGRQDDLQAANESQYNPFVCHLSVLQLKILIFELN